jgi:hypothetical protein
MARSPSPAQQGGTQTPAPQQGQQSTKPGTPPQQQGQTPVIRDWASI